MSLPAAEPARVRRVVSLVFRGHIAGFTGESEWLDPETVTALMKEIFGILRAEVETVGGHVDKVRGGLPDGILRSDRAGR